MTPAAELLRFWGDALVLHPDLGDPERAAAWETALPPAMARAVAGDLGGALDRLVAALADPQTRRARPPVPPPDRPPPVAEPLLSATTDNIAVVRLRRTEDLRLADASERVARSVAAARRGGRAVIDLRRDTPMPDDLRGAVAGGLAGLAPRPAERFRIHTGLVSEDRSDSGDFWSGWQTRAAPTPWNLPRVVFLVNRHSELPAVALTLRAAGCGWIVADDGAPSLVFGASVQRVSEVWLRVGELLGDTAPDRTLAPGEDAMAVAFTLLATSVGSQCGGAFGFGTTCGGTVGGSTGTGEPIGRGPGVAPLRSEDPRVGMARAAALLRRFHPYRAADADRALEALAGGLWAGGAAERTHALRRLAVALRDGHAVVRSPHDRNLFGEATPPLRLRRVGGATIVARLIHPLARALEARPGDEIVSVDGVSAAARRERLLPLLSAGTDAARELYVANRLLSGPVGREARLILRGSDGRRRDVRLPRDPALFPAGAVPERDGAPVRVLAGRVGYLDLDRLQPAEIPAAMAAVRGTRALLLDLRGQANATGWTLAPYLAARDRIAAVRFVCPVTAAHTWLAGGSLERVVVARIDRGPWRYAGRVVCLVDERTQSQSELAGMFFLACGAVCVGRPTAGAVGDVVDIQAGDGVRLSLSGQRVTFPDGRAVQGVGLPRVATARETPAGIAAGRDEVRDTALRLPFLHGR